MRSVGTLWVAPQSWRDYFIEIYDLSGS